VADVYTNDQGCSYIRCRQTSKTVSYRPKATNAQIDGIAVIAGYSTIDIQNDTDVNFANLYNISAVFANFPQ
jgi:hypothetical protein